MLLGETQHRIKNLLSVVQALARQTSVEGVSAKEFRDTFLSRFGALVRSLEASTAANETTLSGLARAALEPFLTGESCISIGPDPEVWLTPGQAMTLGMILHELATNAAKYGALSTQGGQVSVGWSVMPVPDGGQRIELTWTEQDGPTIEPPDHDGFGSKLMRSAVERDLQGTFDAAFSPAGLRVEISFNAREAHDRL